MSEPTNSSDTFATNDPMPGVVTDDEIKKERGEQALGLPFDHFAHTPPYGWGFADGARWARSVAYAEIVKLRREIERLEDIATDDDNYRCQLCEHVFRYDDMDASAEEPGLFYCGPCYKKVPFKTDVEYLRPV